MASATRPFGLRLPPALKRWIEQQAAQNYTNQNSEIVRCVRERMERAERGGPERAPARGVPRARGDR